MTPAAPPGPDYHSGPLRIVHVTPSYAPCVGGAERLLQAVSERLAARGHGVTVLTLDCASQRDFGSRTGAGLPARERINGVEVVRVHPGGSPLLALHEWWIARRGGWRTASWLLGEEFDYHWGRPSGFSTLIPLLRLPADIVATVNWCFGVPYWSRFPLLLRRVPQVAVPILHIDRPWAQRAVYRPMFRACDAAIALTEAEAEHVRGAGVADVAVAGGGVDPERFTDRNGASIRRRYGLGDAPVVGFVGRQDHLKGVPTLIDAMQLVWRETPDVVLLLAGPGAHRDDHVTARLAALAPHERAQVLLLDDFPDVLGPSIIDACDLLAQPSVEEAFGLVLVEAWMCGKPVIGADIAATRSLIEQGQDGWIVAPFDPAALAARILGLLADPAQRTAFGARGRAKVLTRYTWDRITDTWESTYRRVLRARRA